MRTMRPKTEEAPVPTVRVIEGGVTLADVLGDNRPTELVQQLIRDLDLEVGVDWLDQPALTQADARTLRLRIRQLQEEHEVRWQEYQAHLAAQTVQAREAQLEAVRKARQTAREQNRRLGEARQAEAEAQAAAEAEERARAEWEAKGKPLSWEQFAKQRRAS